MIEKCIEYFVKRHLLTNLIVLAVFVGGVFTWGQIKKEQMPDVTFDRVRISAVYPGATAEEVEHFVTRPIEEEVRGIDGIYRIVSTSSQGSSSIIVEIEQNYSNKDEVITEIRNAVLDVDMPDDVRDKPKVNVFKTSKMAIIDIALVHTGYHILDVEGRMKLQQYAHALENQLVSLPHVNSIDRTSYLQEEIQIKVDPDKLVEYDIPLSQVMREVKNNHVRQPAGNIEDQNEPKVTLNAQLDTVDRLNQLIIQAGFEGTAIPLNAIAQVERGFDRGKEIVKVNGHEAVLLNVVKNASYGILESIDAVNKVISRFEEQQLKDSPIKVVRMDDESIDLRNRLFIIATNGILGFVLILITLFLFLNKRSGLWVGLGIPFTMCFSLIAAHMIGYSINNITLAAVIIVMGMVVDDAIVIAENISRLRSQGLSSKDAAVKGTAQVFFPILGSIVTTCIAFIPLFFFEGRFGRMVYFIPMIIFFMLGSSLLESLVILPGHMQFELPKLKMLNNSSTPLADIVKAHWFDKVEDWYGRFLCRILPYKYGIFIVFVVLLAGAILIVQHKMRYEMFPNEETRQITILGEADPLTGRFETADMAKKIEQIVAPLVGEQVVAVRTDIARSRRGGAVEENKFRTLVEIVPREKRRETADQLIAMWRKDIDKIEGLTDLTIQKSRWGQSSGSPIEIIVQENDDALREKASNRLAELMHGHPSLINVDIERPIRIPEYKVDLQREKVKRLGIAATDIATTFRSALQGSVLYEIPKGDETVDVRLTVIDETKTDIEKILDIPVENKQNYLVPLRNVVTVEKKVTPNAIAREDLKRTTTVLADINPGAKVTPLEIAANLEENVFPQVIAEQPTTTLSFAGEVKDTRESGGDFQGAIILVCLLIFMVLAVLFNSFSRPIIIMLAIPFGLVGVVLAFLVHGKFVFGFFAAIGVLGLAGVVINDSIVLVSKLDKELKGLKQRVTNEQIARIVQTRLRAVVLTTLTTVVGILPTAYGWVGYDAMLSEMMLALAWGLCFGTAITLILIPCIYSSMQDVQFKLVQLFMSK
jgi:multidrug efflux pump subunit AcrB